MLQEELEKTIDKLVRQYLDDSDEDEIASLGKCAGSVLRCFMTYYANCFFNADKTRGELLEAVRGLSVYMESEIDNLYNDLQTESE